MCGFSSETWSQVHSYRNSRSAIQHHLSALWHTVNWHVNSFVATIAKLKGSTQTQSDAQW